MLLHHEVEVGAEEEHAPAVVLPAGRAAHAEDTRGEGAGHDLVAQVVVDAEERDQVLARLPQLPNVQGGDGRAGGPSNRGNPAERRWPTQGSPPRRRVYLVALGLHERSVGGRCVIAGMTRYCIRSVLSG